MDIILNTSVKFDGKYTKAQLQQFLDALPDDAEIDVSRYRGDQRDPANSTTYSAKWISKPRPDKNGH